MDDRIGFVVLEGAKILVKVRKSESNRWVSARSRGELGLHLVRVEKVLKKTGGAKRKLQEWKELPI
jgi:hypothetical protein